MTNNKQKNEDSSVISTAIVDWQYQYSVMQPIVFKGIGVHAGKPASLIVHPAAADTGIFFERTDIEDKNNQITADWRNIKNTHMCTVLGNSDGVTIATVEHLLSALSGLGIDNAKITIDGPEVPILDGCAESFCKGILENAKNLKKLKSKRKWLVIEKTVRVENENGWVELQPIPNSNGMLCVFDVMMHPTGRFEKVLQPQSLKHIVNKDGFFKDISAARTFGFYEDAQKLWQAGLAKGSSLENTVVIGTDFKVMNKDGLRYRDEFVRHKALDAIGDLALFGKNFHGMYKAVNPGHTLNAELIRKYFETN